MKTTFYLLKILMLTVACSTLNAGNPQPKWSYDHIDYTAQVITKRKEIYTVTPFFNTMVNGNEFKALNGIITDKDDKTKFMLPYEDIDRLFFWNNLVPEKKSEMRYTKVYEPKASRQTYSLSKTEKWISVSSATPHLTFFLLGYEYQINNNGEFICKQLDISPSIYLQKKEDAYPTFIGYTKGFKDVLLHNLLAFLADDSELCEYIKAKKLSADDMEEIVKRYNPQK